MPIDPTTNELQSALIQEFDVRITKSLVGSLPLRVSDHWLSNGLWAVKRLRVSNQTIFTCACCLHRDTGQNILTPFEDHAVDGMFQSDSVMERWVKTEHIIETAGVDFVRYVSDAGEIMYVRRDTAESLSLTYVYGDTPELGVWNERELDDATIVVAGHREPQNVRLRLVELLAQSDTTPVDPGPNDPEHPGQDMVPQSSIAARMLASAPLNAVMRDMANLQSPTADRVSNLLRAADNAELVAELTGRGRYYLDHHIGIEYSPNLMPHGSLMISYDGAEMMRFSEGSPSLQLTAARHWLIDRTYLIDTVTAVREDAPPNADASPPRSHASVPRAFGGFNHAFDAANWYGRARRDGRANIPPDHAVYITSRDRSTLTDVINFLDRPLHPGMTVQFRGVSVAIARLEITLNEHRDGIKTVRIGFGLESDPLSDIEIHVGNGTPARAHIEPHVWRTEPQHVTRARDRRALESMGLTVRADDVPEPIPTPMPDGVEVNDPDDPIDPYYSNARNMSDAGDDDEPIIDPTTVAGLDVVHESVLENDVVGIAHTLSDDELLESLNVTIEPFPRPAIETVSDEPIVLSDALFEKLRNSAERADMSDSTTWKLHRVNNIRLVPLAFDDQQGVVVCLRATSLHNANELGGEVRAIGSVRTGPSTMYVSTNSPLMAFTCNADSAANRDWTIPIDGIEYRATFIPNWTETTHYFVLHDSGSVSQSTVCHIPIGALASNTNAAVRNLIESTIRDILTNE